MKKLTYIVIIISLYLSGHLLDIYAQNNNSLKKVKLQLKWKHQFQFAGYYAAIEKGYYKKFGLEVEILEARNNKEPAQIVFDKEADFGIGMSDILIYKSKGFEPVVLASIFQHSPLAVLAPKSTGIETVHDLVGKKLMLEDHSADFIAYMNDEGIKLSSCIVYPHTFGMEKIISKEVDASTVYLTTEPFELQKLGIEYNILNPVAGGIDFYGDLLFTSKEYLVNSPEIVDKFVEASLLGWEYAMKNQNEMIDLIYDKYSKRLSKEYLLFEANQMNKFVLPDIVKIGYNNKGRWENILNIYKKYGFVDEKTSIDGLLYDEYKKSSISYLNKFTIILFLIIAIVSAVVFLYVRLVKKLKKEIKNKELIYSELVLNREKYKLISENINDVVWLLDPINKVFTYISPSVKTILGLDDREIIDSKNYEFLKTSFFYNIFTSKDTFIAFDSQNNYNEEFYYKREDTCKWIEINAKYYINPEDNKIQIIGTFKDISIRKQIEADLTKQAGFLDKIIDSLPYPFYIIDANNYKIIKSNSKARVDPENKTITCYSLTHNSNSPCDCANHECPLQKIKEKGEYTILEHLYVDENGNEKIFEVHGYPIYNENNEIIQMIEFSIDISKRKEMEIALIENEKQFHKVIENLPYSMSIITLDGTILYANQKAFELFDLNNEDVIGRQMATFFWINQNERNEWIEKIKNNELVSDFEVQVQTLSGKKLWINMSGLIIIYQNQTCILSTHHDVSNRRMIEDDLRKLYKAVEQSPVSIVITNLEGNIVYVNPKFTSVTGYTKEEAIGKNPRILKSNESAPELYQELWKSLQEGKEWRGVFTNVKKNGELYYESAQISPIKNDNGEITHYLAVKEDITEKKMFENALIESEEKLRTIIDTSPDTFALTNIDGNIQYVSPHGIKLWGYESIEEIRGKNILEFVHPSYHEKAISNIKEMFIGNMTGAAEYLMMRKDGSTFYAEANANILKDAKNNPSGVVYIDRDITERKIAEQLIKESEERHRLLFNTSQEGIVVIQGTKLVYYNPMILEMTGYTADELSKIDFIELIHYMDRALVMSNYMKRISGEEVEKRYQFRLLMKDGAIKWVQLSGVKLKWNNIDSTLNFINDINDLKLAEIELIKLNEDLQISRDEIEINLHQKNALIEELTEIKEKLEVTNSTKDKFFSIIAHDLRNPLGNFREITKLLYDEYANLDEDERKEFIQMIKESSNHVYSLLENLLEWSRSQRGMIQFNPEPVDLFAIVSNCINLLNLSAENKKISLINKLEPYSIVSADANLITTVIRNLISNSIKFTPADGSIQVSAHKFEHEYVVSIIDSGIGMSQEKIDKLFRLDGNVSTKGTQGEAGTGLGLILCKEFIEKHNGSIWVQSKVGQGSNFSFSIPIEL